MVKDIQVLQTAHFHQTQVGQNSEQVQPQKLAAEWNASRLLEIK